MMMDLRRGGGLLVLHHRIISCLHVGHRYVLFGLPGGVEEFDSRTEKSPGT
jgi:hypothetical protein